MEIATGNQIISKWIFLDRIHVEVIERTRRDIAFPADISVAVRKIDMFTNTPFEHQFTGLDVNFLNQTIPNPSSFRVA